MRVCKFYGYCQDQLNKLFDNLIFTLFAYGLEVWGSACKKYLDRIDNFSQQAYRYGYTAKADFEISTFIEERDKRLFNKITTTKDHPLQDLLPPKKVQNVKEKRPRIPTPPDKNWKIQKLVYEQMSF